VGKAAGILREKSYKPEPCSQSRKWTHQMKSADRRNAVPADRELEEGGGTHEEKSVYRNPSHKEGLLNDASKAGNYRERNQDTKGGRKPAEGAQLISLEETRIFGEACA